MTGPSFQLATPDWPLHYQYSFSPSRCSSFKIICYLQISSVFSFSYFFSDHMIAKHPLSTDSSKFINCLDIKHYEQALHSQQNIIKPKPSPLWHTFSHGLNSLGPRSSNKLSPKLYWSLLQTSHFFLCIFLQSPLVVTVPIYQYPSCQFPTPTTDHFSPWPSKSLNFKELKVL